MEELFLSVLNMSLTASYVSLFVILIRLPLKKVPKVISYALWSVVAFRLLCPFSFEGIFSLLPQTSVIIPQEISYQQITQINNNATASDTLVNRSPSLAVTESGTIPLEIYTQVGTYLWLLGVAAMLVYSIVSIVFLKKKLKNSQHIELNIYEADNLKTPFVLGIFRSRIFIPAGLGAEEKGYIIRHEQTHIRRVDHIIKPFAFLILSIHWFNPMVWVAFVLMSTDMELSCDERVIKEMGSEIKKNYSASLLSLATEKRILNGSPLAFGEGNVKGRIKNVLNYKKPAFWIVAVAVIAVVAVSIGLLFNPKSDTLTQSEARGIVEEHYPSAINITARDNQIINNGVDFECYTFYVELPDADTNEIVAVDKSKGIFFTYNEADGLWYAFTGLREKDSLEEDVLNFKTTETDLVEIGRIAFSEYVESLTNEETPDNERIAYCKLNSISLLAGDINEFCVSINYDFTTDNDNYINPGIGAKGKGIWPDNYMEIRIKNIGKYAYEIVGIGTGGGGSGLEPYIQQMTTLKPTTPEWSSKQSVSVDMAELDYASDNIVIFHDYFGLFVYDLDTLEIFRSLDLKPLNCNQTQGDNYCEVSVSMDGNTIQLHPLSSENMYIYTVSDDTLQETTYQPMENRFSNFIPTEELIHFKVLAHYSHSSVKFGTDDYGYLYTSDWTLGTLSYSRGDMMYKLFD